MHPRQIEAMFGSASVDYAEVERQLAELDRQLLERPDDTALYRARALLHRAVHEYEAAYADFKRVLEGLPGDRESALGAAAVQHRIAYSLASPDQDDDADPDEAATDAEKARLESDAVERIAALMELHAGDRDFALKILDAWEDIAPSRPWVHYRLILQALARHPRDFELLRREALFLCTLAGETTDSMEKVPMGFFADVTGGFHHALTVDRALRTLDPLMALPEAQEDVALLQGKANLLCALERYDEAAALFRDCARIYAQYRQEHPGPADAVVPPLEAEMTRQAAACSGGRAVYLAAHLAQLDDALQKIANRKRPPPRVQAVANVDEHLAKAVSALRDLRDSLEAQLQAPSAEDLAKSAEAATKTAANMVKLVELQPVEMREVPAAQLAAPLLPWFAEIEPQLRRSGMELVCLVENLANSRAFNQQIVGQFWSDGSRSFALVAEAVKTIRLARAESEFSDGSLLITANSRGTSYWYNGPLVDTVTVEKSTSLDDMARLHQARLAARLAASPGLGVRSIDTVQRVAEVEDRMRCLKNAHRLEHGIVEQEIRGMNQRNHEYFSDVIRAAVANALAPLRKAQGTQPQER